MKAISKSRQYVIIFAITALSVMIYLLCHKADMAQPISFDVDKAIDGFIDVAAMDAPVTAGLKDCEYNIQNIAMLVLIKICSNIWIGINIYYLLTFFMISLSMYHFLQKMQIPVPIAMGIAVLTAFVPFHVDRGEGQMLTSNFFLAPLFIEMFYSLIYCHETNHEIGYKKGYIVLVCLAPLIDVRISMMACILFVLLLLQRHDKKITKQSAWYFFLFFIITFIIGNVSMTLKAADIQMAKDEGMRILDMTEPMRYHVVGRLSNIRFDYDISFSANGESGLNSMGLLFVIGFVCLMFGLFFEWKKDRRIAWMGMISIFVIVIAGNYGMGLIFEYFGLHVTYWNRMAVFIIICSAAALGIVLGNLVAKVEKRFGHKAMTAGYVVMAMVFILGFFELILRQNL